MLTRALWLSLGLGVVTFLTMSPSLWNGFVGWDDSTLLSNNPAYRGLGWQQLRWMFTNTLLGHYVPLTWVSFGLDYVLWGTGPFGYHLTNLLLHTANAVLFFVLALRLLPMATSLSGSARQVSAAVAALFFAVHPLRVESVAWLTERRGVLSGFFFLATVLLYLTACRAARERRWWLLAGSVGTYVLALAAKASVMTLPLVLVLLDLYPLRRLPADPRRWWARSARRVWAEKVPYVVLGVCGAVASYYGQATGAIVVSLEPYQWVGLTLHSLWFHVYKTVLPLRLSPLYELPLRIDPLEPRFLVAAVGVIAISVAVLGFRRAWPAGLASWVYYGILLAPVTAVAHAGPQITADRYSYLSCLGWALLVGAGAGVAVRTAARRGFGRVSAGLMVGAGVLGLLGLAALTWHQVQVWRGPESLWRHAIAATPDCSICHVNLGNWLHEQGSSQAALDQFQQVLRLRPDRIRVRVNMGLALASLGRSAEAAEQYRLVLARYPQEVPAHINLATALIEMGQPREALEQLEQVMRLEKPEDTVDRFRHAVAAKPDALLPRLGLVRAYVALGRPDLAREQYEVLRALDPALAAFAGGLFTPGG